MRRLIHVVGDAVKQRYLSVSLCKLLIILVTIGYSLVGAHLQFHHLVCLFIAFKLAFGAAQLRINLF